jgi:hypothetical protein
MASYLDWSIAASKRAAANLQQLLDCVDNISDNGLDAKGEQ